MLKEGRAWLGLWVEYFGVVGAVVRVLGLGCSRAGVLIV